MVGLNTKSVALVSSKAGKDSPTVWRNVSASDYEGQLERTPIVSQILSFENWENPEKAG